jgi:hypothetical protein
MNPKFSDALMFECGLGICSDPAGSLIMTEERYEARISNQSGNIIPHSLHIQPQRTKAPGSRL